MAREVSEFTFAEVVESLDIFWLLFGAILVFFMQIGFSMLEVGSVQEKSTRNVLIKNAFDVCVTAVCWAVSGHALAYGKSIDSPRGVFGGTTGYFMFGNEGDAHEFALWLFNWAFVSTAATIVSGAVAERIYFHSYVVFVFLYSLIVYPLIVHWTWSNDGFLSAHRDKDLLYGCGVLDFAGSGVVHVVGGACALMALLFLGPRDTVYFEKGVRHAPPGQSPSFQSLGTLCLWFGWFGFNGCSSGHLVGSVRVATTSMVNTALGGAVGGLTSACLAMFGDWLMGVGPLLPLPISATLNGILVGLVAITANCATVKLEGAFAIGVGSGLVYHYSARWLESKGMDDVVQAVPVHLFGGVWGMVAVGLFTAPGPYGNAFAYEGGIVRSDDCAGLLYGGSGKQMAAQLTFLAVVFPWLMVTVGSLFWVLNHKKMLRIPRIAEIVGADLMYHNEDPNREANECDMELTKGGADQRLKHVHMPPTGFALRENPLPTGTPTGSELDTFRFDEAPGRFSTPSIGAFENALRASEEI
mmetsp:Transcript_57761/g.116069  ORF Transcript_57761/g.116069 Transcript_57761/m.116069 type:complete len:527 (+) Transcript_57761:172-1752(+)